MTRTENINRATSEDFDICIIGGGITGAGLLANAIERGWKAILVEKNDVASGTSSRSSKVIHGGLRYLKFLKFKLVHEALQERSRLLKLFPYLVKPIPFVLPSYHSNTDLCFKKILLVIYDYLARKAAVGSHKKLSAKQVVDILPGYNNNDLKGGIIYWEAWTNDARLTIDVLSSTSLKGGIVLNYMEAEAFQSKGKTVESVRCLDKVSGQQITINARVFINATGVWTDQVLDRLTGHQSRTMKPSKGVHVVISSEKLPGKYASIVPSKADKRYLYTLPWDNNLTILGTTDTEYDSDADKVEVTLSDVEYILDAFNAGFPEANLTLGHVTSVFAGLRPLLAAETDSGSYRRSREYQVWWTGSNFVSIAGGKLTSFLSMGKKCLNAVKAKFPDMSNLKTGFTSENYSGKWVELYGPLGKFVEGIITETPAYSQNISVKWRLTKAEIIFFIRYQYAEQVEDVLTRRISITYAMKDYDADLVKAVATLMSIELQKESSWVEEQNSKYYEHWLEYHPPFLQSFK